MPSVEPFRIRLLQALTAKLETITVANGYRHDLAGSVYRGVPRFGEESGTTFPFVAILQSPLGQGDQVQQAGGGISVGYPLVLEIACFVIADDVHPTDPADRLMADVTLCLAREINAVNTGRQDGVKFCGIRAVSEVEIDERTANTPEEGSSVCHAVIALRMLIAEDLLQPYDQ